jgi:hypothetical protein
VVNAVHLVNERIVYRPGMVDIFSITKQRLMPDGDLVQCLETDFPISDMGNELSGVDVRFDILGEPLPFLIYNTADASFGIGGRNILLMLFLVERRGRFVLKLFAPLLTSIIWLHSKMIRVCTSPRRVTYPTACCHWTALMQ